MNSFYTEGELRELPIKYIGSNVLISRKVSFYSDNIVIGNNVRIDDYCILSGKIILGSNIHIGAYSALYGSFGIEMEDYTGLSPRCTIFSATDDFGGEFLISPMAKKEFTSVTGGTVKVKKYSQIGAHSILMPNIEIGVGTAIGSMSLVKSSTDEWSIYCGIPAKKIKDRKRGLLKFIDDE